nr:MAG TPA: hypothetical protein [Caudoviricetes sp.]
MTMKYLHPYLYEIVHDLVQQRVADKKFPYVAIANDVKAKVLSDVSTALDEMVQDGLLARSSNINGIGLYRTLKDKEDENNHV